jgi:hypothetical protein
MQFLAGQPSTSVSRFDGPQQTVEIPNLGPTQAVEAINCRYTPTGVGCRKGWAQGQVTTYSANPNRRINSFFNWIGANFNRLLMLVGGLSVRMRDLVTNTEYVLGADLSGTCVGMSVDVYGGTAYIAGYNFSGSGVQKFPFGVDARLVAQDPLDPVNLVADPLWPGPGSPNSPVQTTVNITATTPVAATGGNVSAGVHYFTAVYTTRTGYVFQPLQVSPLLPAQTLTASGTQNYTVQFNVAAGLAGTYSRLQFAMTPANENINGRYFIIPSASNSYLVTPSGITGGVLQVGVNDEDLIATGTNILEFQQNFFQGQTINGVAVNLRPYIIKAFGDRMVYVCRIPSSSLPGSQLVESAAFISDPGLPQTISFAQSIWQLPGARAITAWATMRDFSYVFGPTYTYLCYQGLGKPVTWQTAQIVDEQLGAINENCIAKNPSKGIVWVANQQGIWVLVGASFAPKPITWYCTDWDRIAWEYQTDLCLVDNLEDLEIRFRCWVNNPDFTVSAKVFVFSYQRGLTPEAIQYSLHDAESAANSVNQGTGFMDNVLDPITGETRLARTNAYPFSSIVIGVYEYLKLNTSATLYQDWSASADTNVSIASSYEHAPLPADNWTPLKFNGVQMAISTPGGTVNPSVKDKSGTRILNLAPISGETASPEATVTRMFDMQTEGLRARIDALGGWILHKLEVFNGGPLSFRR